METLVQRMISVVGLGHAMARIFARNVVRRCQDPPVMRMNQTGTPDGVAMQMKTAGAGVTRIVRWMPAISRVVLNSVKELHLRAQLSVAGETLSVGVYFPVRVT